MRVTSSRTTIRDLARTVDRRFLVLDTTVRLPTAMLPLGTLLYVAARTGSFGTGGLAVAALSLGGGLGGPLVGLAADRIGQRRTVLLATTVQAATLSLLLALHGEEPLAATLGLAALVGVANPQAGAMARARWSVAGRARADRSSFVSTAMAVEGTIDEASFVVGPVLVSTVAGLVSPSAGLLVALVLAVITQVGFGLHPSALPASAGSERTRRRPALRLGVPLVRLAALLVAMASVGVVFGVTQTGVAARMAAVGTPGLTGPVYAAMGVGSALTGLLSTRLPRGFRHELRIVAAGILLVAGGVIASSAGSALALAGACLFLGVALAPTMISSYALAERAAPAAWSTSTMTALATANVVGVAAGAAIAGALVDAVSPGTALLLDCAAGALVALAGGAASLLLRRTTLTRG